MSDLNDLYYYAQVVEHGGFAPAGRALNIPKSKLSRRIAVLEARLGPREGDAGTAGRQLIGGRGVDAEADGGDRTVGSREGRPWMRPQPTFIRLSALGYRLSVLRAMSSDQTQANRPRTTPTKRDSSAVRGRSDSRQPIADRRPPTVPRSPSSPNTPTSSPR